MNPQQPAPTPAATSPAPEPANNSKFPVNVTIDYPEKQSRLLALSAFLIIRFLILIPVYICLYFLFIAIFFCAVVNYLFIIFTGHSNKGLHGFIVGVMRWSMRTSAFLFGLTDKYPPFRLSE